jgi:dTDP-4-amino-4,6-dideoxygalactose transaminase
LFHTGEGGALFCKDPELFHQLYYSHNFGHDGPLAFHGLGINGKMSELNAAMGLAVLPYLGQILNLREEVVAHYKAHLKHVQSFVPFPDTNWNFSYFPILFESENTLGLVEKKLKENNILPRRYFYPSLSKLPYSTAEGNSVSEDISSRILCLPLYGGISSTEIGRICGIIESTILNYQATC